ncbi:hypothetical protein ACB092_09G178700 [Castanea dentata]
MGGICYNPEKAPSGSYLLGYPGRKRWMTSDWVFLVACLRMRRELSLRVERAAAIWSGGGGLVVEVAVEYVTPVGLGVRLLVGGGRRE